MHIHKFSQVTVKLSSACALIFFLGKYITCKTPPKQFTLMSHCFYAFESEQCNHKSHLKRCSFNVRKELKKIPIVKSASSICHS